MRLNLEQLIGKSHYLHGKSDREKIFRNHATSDPHPKKNMRKRT